MKSVLYVLFLFLLSGCSNQKTIDFYYGQFKLFFTPGFLAGATIFSADIDDLTIKTASGSVISGQILSNRLEGLPSEFDFRQYPKYILRIEPLTDLADGLAQTFVNTSGLLDDEYGLKNLEIWQSKDVIIYSLCSNKNTGCWAFIVKDTVKDHIFSVHTTDIHQMEFKKILTDNLHVD